MASTQSKACCSLPAVVSEGYKEKGEYITIDGMKTYVTGPSSAKKAILIVYDIFGFFPQTIQGADILAYSDKENEYQVFIPDFFEGSAADISWYPPDNKEKEAKLGEFFQTKAQPPKTLERLHKVLKEIESQRSSITTWGVVGFCWGGKIANLSSKAGTSFKAAAAAHPAMVDANDAPEITIPFALLPSKDEPKEDVEKWEKALKVEHIVEWYPNQIHGWLAARADLKDSAVEADYKKGYETILNWFHKHL